MGDLTNAQHEALLFELGEAMSELSEECWCAGWDMGTEETVPALCRAALATGTAQPWGMGTISVEEARRLVDMAERLGCWAAWSTATGGALLPPHPAVGERLPGVVRCMDVRNWHPLPAWGWWASPPCQRHSTAGNGTGPDGFPMLLDALDRAAAVGSMPTWLLAENVRGALSDGTVDQVVEELRERFPFAGYWLVDCAELWLPQHRVRVVIWAGPRELPALPMRYRPLTPVKVATGLCGVLDGGRNSDANPTQERPRTTYEPAQTVGTRGNLMFRVHEVSRRLTVAECARLQGFPDGWPWQGNAEQRYRQAGNAVPPVLAEWCWRHVIRCETMGPSGVEVHRGPERGEEVRDE